MTQDREGQVITFYSYKGGTGRTMALANTAWILAANGKKVLVADWDLESPGLHRFFAAFIDSEALATTGGVMDLIGDYDAAVAAAKRPDGSLIERPADWHLDYAKVQTYAFTLKWKFESGGSLDILLAGKSTPDYVASVTGRDWDNFYNRLGGAQFFDALREDMKRHYDYTLIDSRTGISDVAEICTIHLPDVLVDCFTFSNQGIEGAAEVAERVAMYEGTRPRRVLPVPMRVDEGEKNKADAGRALAMQKFSDLPQGMTGAERRAYWLSVEVPYRAYYAYEEILATFGDPPGSRNSLLPAYERLTSYITNREITELPPIDEALRTATVAKLERRPAIRDEVLLLRHTPADQAWAEWIQAVLTNANLRVVDLAMSERTESDQSMPVRDVVLLSKSYLDATGRRSELGRPPGTLAIHLDGTPPMLDIPLANWILLDGLGEEQSLEQLLTLVGRVGSRAAGGRFPRLPRFPAEPAPVFRAPARNMLFTAREALMSNLREELRTGGPGPVALVGGAGMGKTQLAMEYAYRFRGAYDIIWWISADPPQFVDMGIVDLGAALEIPRQPTVPDRIRAVDNRLSRRDAAGPLRWLLVFDNVEKYNAIEEYLPRGDGHLLLTTRDQVEAVTHARIVNVDKFLPIESVGHLLSRVRTLDPADAARIAEMVEHVPIFVALAGAWLAETKRTATDYLSRLGSPDPSEPIVDRVHVWNVSLERLAERSPAAYRLLQLASVLAPEISHDLLRSEVAARIIAEHDKDVARQLRLRANVGDIAATIVQHINRLALIKLEANQLQIHRLLQNALRRRMSAEELDGVTRDVHRLLVGSRPTGEVEDPEIQEQFRILWPHLDGAKPEESDSDDVRALLIDRIRYIYVLGGYEQGEAYAEEVNAAWTAQLAQLEPDSAEHDRLLVRLLELRFNLANLKRSRGKFQESYDLNADTLRRQEALLGPTDARTLATASSLGGDLRALGRYDDALERDQQTYRASVDALGEEHRRTLIFANNLGASLRLVGDFQQARRIDEDTYDRWVRVSGEHHPRTLRSANNLGRDLREAGEYGNSVDLLREVVKGYQKLYGDQYREALTAQTNLAASLRGTGQIQEAARLLDQAYHGLKDSYGPTSPDTALTRLSRAANLQLQGLAAETRQELVETEVQLVGMFGTDHPYVQVCRANLAVTLADAGDANGARALTAATTVALDAQLGPKHPIAMAVANNHAVFTISTGDLDDGRDLLSKALDRLREELGNDHPDTLRTAGNLAIANQSSPEAPRLERIRIADQLANRIGQDHPSVLALREGRYIRRILDPHPY
ncbi:FxSxx-COOH system tetratricopeptide repeat protein [Dactylosporangium sucinum]|uniref:ATP/GTP-binding protein n=1 Tax=Dactylosporangium sucinum TaxID=1424081 RepID=A0A917WXN8_9ACTN|nr:FxSxx-COOH system tetratricopeptide repeat protein [Dactylosporangium sucinum]GGM39700.1 hypothetical protein GCM10007977_046390 [Dactylosporangium sucinum]